MNKHTSGEWKAKKGNVGAIADHIIIADDKIIAFCPTGYPFENVQLMAAAKVMLDALQDVASSSCCLSPGCSIEEPYCETMIARAAIAKATGKHDEGDEHDKKV